MPSLSQPKRTRTREVLTAIRAELVRLEVLNEDQITWCATTDVPNWSAEHRLLLRPRGFTSGRAHNDGQGRVTGELRRLLDVHVRVRDELDQADEAKLLLLAEDGYFDTEDAVVDALDMFWPEDSNGDVLLIEPMRVIDAQTAEKSELDSWAQAFATFEFVYLPRLDQTRQ